MSEEVERVLGTGAQHLSEMQVGKALVKAQSANSEKASVVVTEKATDAPLNVEGQPAGEPVAPVVEVPAPNETA